MTTLHQLLLGTAVLGLCSAIHLVGLILTAAVLRFSSIRLRDSGLRLKWAILTAIAFAIIVFSHTAQIWVWAVSFIMMEALPNFSDALYFALVTYTTLGYGDVTLEKDFRLFAAMAAVTGLLTFGLSTAFLVALIGRLLPFSDDQPGDSDRK